MTSTPLPDIVILGYSEAAMLVRQAARPEISAVLSIHGRREFGVELAVPHRLDLAFDDVEVPDETDPVAAWRANNRRRWAEQNGLIEQPPTRDDAAAIIRFAERVRDCGLMLCHCHAGMSRAPAAALICLAVWQGPGSEAACVEKVRSLRAGAVPHVGLVRFADELLGRGGKLAAVTGV